MVDLRLKPGFSRHLSRSWVGWNSQLDLCERSVIGVVAGSFPAVDFHQIRSKKFLVNSNYCLRLMILVLGMRYVLCMTYEEVN